MGRRWHDWVIVLAIVALAGVGIAALWGPSIAAWLAPEPSADQAEGPAASMPASGSRIWAPFA